MAVHWHASDIAAAPITTDSNPTAAAGRVPPEFGIEKFFFMVFLAIIFFLLAQSMVRHRFDAGGRFNRNGTVRLEQISPSYAIQHGP